MALRIDGRLAQLASVGTCPESSILLFLHVGIAFLVKNVVLTRRGPKASMILEGYRLRPFWSMRGRQGLGPDICNPSG